MITSAQNDFLTRTGPGTPMGNLFRRYWIPALAVAGGTGAGLSAGARQASLRAAAGVSRHAGARGSRLRRAALAVEHGDAPDGIDPASHAVRSASRVLPDDVGFYEDAAGALDAKEGVAHTSV
jgi:hypothetical protein